MRKLCGTCGLDFEPKSNRQKFCSSCGRRGFAVCQVCNKHFTLKSNTTGLYCSRQCFMNGSSLFARPCEFCKQTFKPHHSEQRFCSKQCQANLTKANQTRKCLVCESKFQSRHSHQQTCNKICSGKLRQAARNTTCLRCGTTIPFNANRHKMYCSQQCRGEPVGSKRTTDQGYVKLKISSNDGHNSKWMMEHRHIMEIKLGRPLHPRERIHHKNGIRTDNRLENLELWVLHNKSKKDPSGSRVEDLYHQAINRVLSIDEVSNLSEEIQQKIKKALLGE